MHMHLELCLLTNLGCKECICNLFVVGIVEKNFIQIERDIVTRKWRVAHVQFGLFDFFLLRSDRSV